MWDIYADSEINSTATLLVILYATCILGGFWLVSLLRARGRTKLAESAEASVGDEAHPLVEGADVVLCGRVRHMEDHDVAVKVEIIQDGSENESSGSWTHSWTEIDREIIVKPFLLELPNGTLVRVDAPKNVDVADDLDQKVWINRNQRILSAELVPDEKIWARGRLERSDIAVPSSAYREVSWGWALGPADGQMLLSSEPMGRGFRARAKWHSGAAMIALLLLVGVHLSLFWFYGRARGPVTISEVTSKRHFVTTDSDDRDTHHYEITFDGPVVDDNEEIDDEPWREIERGSQIKVRGSDANWNLGSEPTIHVWHAIVLIVTANSYAVMYHLRRRSSRPWFRRKVKESGPGQLPDPPAG